MKEFIIAIAILVSSPLALAQTDAQRYGVTTAIFDKCYSQLDGWHGWAKDFKRARDTLLRKINNLPYNQKMEAIDMGEQWQKLLDQRLVDNNEAYKFCEEKYSFYGLDDF